MTPGTPQQEHGRDQTARMLKNALTLRGASARVRRGTGMEDAHGRLVAGGGDLPDLSAVVPGLRTATASATSRASPSGCPTSPTSASTRSGCRRSSPRRWPTWATTSPTIPTSTRSSARSPTSTRWSRAPTSSGSRSSSTRCCRIRRAEHPFFKESRQSRDNPKADWYVWADPKHDGSPPNNWLVGLRRRRLGSGRRRRRQYYLHNFLAEQPDFNFHNPEVQDWLLSTMRFWLERGVDGFRLDTVNFYFHDKLLRDDPADFRRKDEARGQPLRHAVPHLLEEPAGEPRLPRADAQAARRVRGPRAWSARWARATTPSG